MADSQVIITQGSGTSIDTRTENLYGNHRQVVVLGDPTENSGVATVINGKLCTSNYEQETPPTDPTKLNPSQVITPITVGDVTTTTIVKTIDGTTYTKTIAKNNVSGVVTISAWV